jgi:hypothetical protein
MDTRGGTDAGDSTLTLSHVSSPESSLIVGAIQKSLKVFTSRSHHKLLTLTFVYFQM